MLHLFVRWPNSYNSTVPLVLFDGTYIPAFLPLQKQEVVSAILMTGLGESKVLCSFAARCMRKSTRIS